jgi:hypothetical protein
LRDRTREINHKQLDLFNNQIEDISTRNIGLVDFSRLKVGPKQLEDAIIQVGSLKKANPTLAKKDHVLKAIADSDIKEMRRISDFFYKTSGIYSRIVKYMAYMYRYDWIVTPDVYDKSLKQDYLLKNFRISLNILDNFKVKKMLGEIALKVFRYGAYYGYKVETENSGVTLQELPADYCRVRYFSGQKPVVEFKMSYFDEAFRDSTQKIRILNVFPKEFKKGYELYKAGKLAAEGANSMDSGWYMLDPENTVRFTVNGEEYPTFISVIPLIIDLDEAQELDRRKTLQRLLKIVIQKLPMDKNGYMIFDGEESAQIHNNAVAMLSRAINIDVLTTLADTEIADLSASKAETQTDDLIRVERQLYNEAGVSQMQFNTDGNIALEKSILNDEASIYNLLLQFEDFLNELLLPVNKKPRKVLYKVQILPTTIYNYKDMAKLYKEQMQLGFSKMLPQIALGQSQSSILANAFFENEVLDLVNVFIPPLMSSTMNADILNRTAQKGGQGEEKTAGRKELEDDQKSEKTILNRESMK